MSEIDDTHISVRFKHGIHTIYMFVREPAPFHVITDELLQLIQERYPNGLTTAIAPPKTTPVSSTAKLAYGVLNVPNDPSRGWKKLNLDGDKSSPASIGLQNNSIVAFTVVDDEDDDVEFEVEWPRDDEEMYEQAQ